jgi:transposase InsO family protein
LVLPTQLALDGQNFRKRGGQNFRNPQMVLEEAIRKREASPSIFHSDQGSEYTAHACIQWIVDHKILPSHSPKANPWRNGHQESFYDKFKLEFGKPSRHATIEILMEAIGRYIHYYNTRRIHSSLKMPPRAFFLSEKTGTCQFDIASFVTVARRRKTRTSSHAVAMTP